MLVIKEGDSEMLAILMMSLKAILIWNDMFIGV